MEDLMADYTTDLNDFLGLPCDDQNPYDSSHSSLDYRLPKFLAAFANQLHFSQPESKRGLFVFWSQNVASQNTQHSDDPGLAVDITDPCEIHQAIKSAFCEVELSSFDGLIQFWAPVEISNTRLLTTLNQPFALKYLDSGLQKHRLCSLKYQYNIDLNKLEVGDDTTVIRGLPANAFMNHLAEVVLDMRVHHESPLVRSALECELLSYFVLPICDPSQSRCVGVVECSANKLDDLLEIFIDLTSALKRVGLCTFHGQERLPYEITSGLKCATDEIEEALERVCESHDLTLAQLWISYENDTHMKRTIPLKLIGHYINSDDEDCFSFKDYYCICDMLPLKIGDGLMSKALQNYEPQLCRNIYAMSNNNELHMLFPITITQLSCFVICLRSIETGNLDYVFEFLWGQTRNRKILLESLILTLKGCLPNFKFVSGAELGDELHVMDFKFGSGVQLGEGLGDIKIFEGNKSSPIPKVLERGRKCIEPLEAKNKTARISLSRNEIEQQFGRTMKQAAKNLKVCLSTLKRKCKDERIFEWQGPKFASRKVNDLYENQSDTHEEDNEASQGSWAFDENTVTIKAKYEDDVTKFHFPISLTTFEAVEREIGQRFKLKLTTYKLKYQDEDKEWILMTCDQDITDCIKSSTSVNDTQIKLCVLRST